MTPTLYQWNWHHCQDFPAEKDAGAAVITGWATSLSTGSAHVHQLKTSGMLGRAVAFPREALAWAPAVTMSLSCLAEWLFSFSNQMCQQFSWLKWGKVKGYVPLLFIYKRFVLPKMHHFQERLGVASALPYLFLTVTVDTFRISHI